MRFGIIGLVLSAVAATPAVAQNAPAAPPIVRTVVAGTRLSGVGATPLYFRALSLTIPPGATTRISAPDGILYQLSGWTDVAAAGASKTLAAGEAQFIAGGQPASLTAGRGRPSSALYFLLASAADHDRRVASAPAKIAVLYRTPAPIPDLKPGDYELNLTRVTFPPRMPSNPPHHRSGAALYFILSGTGANTVVGATLERGPHSLIYEPSGLVHQWGNPGNEPLTSLAFNINQQGVAAVIPETPQR